MKTFLEWKKYSQRKNNLGGTKDPFDSLRRPENVTLFKSVRRTGE